MIHGAAKLWLVIGLLFGKLCAYPSTLGFLSFFIAYQLYRLSVLSTNHCEKVSTNYCENGYKI